MSNETDTPDEAEAEAAQSEPADDPDELIKVRWDGPPRVFPDYVRAIRRNDPDRAVAKIQPGDILEIRRRHRTRFHADTTSKADPINVIKES